MNTKAKLKDTMKTSLGGGLSASKGVDSIFTATAHTKVVEETEPHQEIQPKVKAVPKQKKPDPMDKITVPMSYRIKEAIDDLAKAINRNGQKKKERITANSVIRGVLQLITSMDVDVSNIDSEDSLKKAILKAITEARR